MGNRVVGKANKGINVKKIGFKKVKIKTIKKREKRKKTDTERKKGTKKGKLHRTAKAQCRGRGL